MVAPIPSSNIQYVNHPLLKPNKVIKRKYQQAIFATCARNNCLVVIPTGLGKTIIALLLAVHQWKDPNAKIVFLAPTRPLVEQHQQTFCDLTIFEPEQLPLITGSITPEKRALLYQMSSIRALFLTPQIVQNDLISGRFSFKNVSLIIFDEAHRAVGDYAYTFIAKKYWQDKFVSNRKTLAMTASPGKNREKIMEVMQNLYLNTVEIRTESDSDVKPYIQNVSTEWIEVQLPDELKEILETLNQLEKQILSELKKNSLIKSRDISKVNRKDLLSAGKELDLLIIRNHNQGELPRLLYCKKLLSNAIRVSHMKELIEAQGLAALTTYLEKNMQKVQAGKGGVSLRELFSSESMNKIIQHAQELEEQKIFHPKFKILMSLLHEQFKSSDNSRILIFCQFRDTVKILVEKINEVPLFRAMRFVGQQNKGKEKGLTQKEQKQILQDFKTGIYNILVATSVAEEGLDIAECDVVIFFDVIPSEIRSIQRRGRTGRNSSGKVIILKTTGTREDAYYWAERHREKEMKRILKDLQYEMNKFSSNPGQDSKKFKNSKSKQENNLLKYIQNPPELHDLQDSTKSNDSIKHSEDPSSLITTQSIHLDENHTLNHLKENESVDISDSDTIIHSKITDFSLKKQGTSPYILVDSRETASPITRILSEMNVTIDLQTLLVGDYIVSQRCGIERKSIQDFVDSIKDGRLFDELRRLRNQFSHPILLLEGNYHKIISINRAAILGTLTSIMLKFQVFLIQTQDAHDSAEMIRALALKEQKSNSKSFSIRFKKIPEQLDKQLEQIVAGIPGINLTRAQDLLREFRTLRALFNASPEDLKKIHQIGSVLAEKIHKYANLDYFLKEVDNYDTNK
ncbi:MAG: DEAD/DEAH box helicase [Candidatus Lokiarchaeota archaeon]|nr:DEAD/DEAH box helicase [Candidatus Harpocratesius repetitus]